MERNLVCTALVADVVFGIPHMIFHAMHLQHFPPGDAIVQTISLAVVVLIPLALLILTVRPPRTARFE
jgi:hypothetical protein